MHYRKLILMLLGLLYLSLHSMGAQAAQQWHSANGNLEGAFIDALTYNPKQPDELFAGTYMGGLYQSNNGGLSWHQLGAAQLGTTLVTTIAINPQNPQEVYVSTYNLGSFKSEDHGETWQSIYYDKRKFNRAVTFQFNPVNPRELFWATEEDGIYKSIDNGKTWQKLAQPGNGGEEFRCLAMSPVNPNEMLVAVHTYSPHGEQSTVYKSNDQGVTWRAIANPFKGQYVSGIYYAANGVDIYLYTQNRSNEGRYSDLYLSRNGGEAWSKISPEGLHTDITGFAVQLGKDNHIYLHDEDGQFFESMDEGAHWQLMTTMTDTSISELLVRPDQANIVYAVGRSGLLMSQDHGRHWAEMKSGLANLQISSIAVTPRSQSVFASIRGVGLLQSSDGVNWQTINFPADAASIGQIAIDPVHPENLFAYVGMTMEHGSEGMFYTHDAGKTWIKSKMDDPFSIQCITVNPVNPKQIFACEYGADYIYMSEDGGQVWDRVEIDAGTNAKGFFSIAINPKHSKQVYAVGFGGIFKSEDGGFHWKLLTQFYQSLSKIVIDPRQPNVMYAAGLAGFYKSNDGGLSWEYLYIDLPAGIPVNQVVIDPADSNIIYASAYNDLFYIAAGIFVSIDGGDTWSPYSDGLTNQAVTAINWFQGQLIAGTSGGGMFMNAGWHKGDPLNAPLKPTAPRFKPVKQIDVLQKEFRRLHMLSKQSY